MALFWATLCIVDACSCWTRHSGAFEWIIYTPNLACLLVCIHTAWQTHTRLLLHCYNCLR